MTTTENIVSRRKVEAGTWLYLVDGKPVYTVTRLYNHLPWTIRDGEGWPVEHFRSLVDADKFIRGRHV